MDGEISQRRGLANGRKDPGVKARLVEIEKKGRGTTGVLAANMIRQGVIIILPTENQPGSLTTRYHGLGQQPGESFFSDFWPGGRSGEFMIAGRRKQCCAASGDQEAKKSNLLHVQSGRFYRWVFS